VIVNRTVSELERAHVTAAFTCNVPCCFDTQGLV